MRRRHMKATRLEDTKLWLYQRLFSDPDFLPRQIARLAATMTDAELFKTQAGTLMDAHEGKMEGVREILEMLSKHTEETFTFDKFLTEIERRRNGLYKQPIGVDPKYTSQFSVLYGRANAYEGLDSHLRDRISMTVPGSMDILYDKKPRNHEWKKPDNQFSIAAS